MTLPGTLILCLPMLQMHGSCTATMAVHNRVHQFSIGINPSCMGEVKVELVNFNPISIMCLRDTLYTCDGFSAIWYFSLLFKIGNDNVTIQGFIKQYFHVIFKTDDGINTIQGFSLTWVLVTLPYITSFLHA
jgi:hypothetical protein